MARGEQGRICCGLRHIRAAVAKENQRMRFSRDRLSTPTPSRSPFRKAFARSSKKKKQRRLRGCLWIKYSKAIRPRMQAQSEILSHSEEKPNPHAAILEAILGGYLFFLEEAFLALSASSRSQISEDK